MGRVEHSHGGAEFRDGCPRCKLDRAAKKAIKNLDGAVRAAERAKDRNPKLIDKLQHDLYDAAPKWGDG